VAAAFPLLFVAAFGCAQEATGGKPLSAPAPGGQANAATGGAAAAKNEHPLMPAIKLARASRKALEEVKDYEATFIKREQINGQLLTQTMQLKVREEPYSVYLKYQDPSPGREILFVKGQNQNMLLAHEASGLKSLLTVNLAMDDPRVKAENRHAIVDLGMRRMVEMTIKQWEEEAKYGEVDVRYYPDAKIGGVLCPAIECSHPRPRRQFPFHVTRLYLDSASNLPVRIENYGFPTQAGQDPPLVEEYTYVKIKTNVGFKNADFARENPSYKFN
jgi:hypothetical protein